MDAPSWLDDVQLEGELVRLRPPGPGDAAVAFPSLRGRRDVVDRLVWDGPECFEDLESIFAAWHVVGADGHDYHLSIRERASDAFRGMIGVRFQGHPTQADVGYWIAPEAWGRGYASEALRLVCWLCFERLGALLVYAQVFTDNAASQHVLEKCGFGEDPLGRDVVRKGDGERERLFYALARSRWRREHGGFEPALARLVPSG